METLQLLIELILQVSHVGIANADIFLPVQSMLKVLLRCV
uniref:Uncharacterized protein n=1 Tax=Anguilla anguilla TaxID=7936 RepID=A0A0E9VLB6_ANGAN